MKIRLIAVLVVVAGLVAACSSGEGTGGQLDGTKWILRSYLVDSTLTLVPDTEYADAEFDASRVSGFGGCNRYDALYRTGGRTLFITDPASTLMACVEPSMDFETAYLALLGQSRFYTARADTLTIFGPGGETLLVYDAAPANPLLGRWVVDSYANAPGSVVAVLPGTELDVVFGIGSVAGFAGCNQFSGTYGTNGNVVRIGQLATTRLACADDVMTQETAFLEALQGAALIEARTATATLKDLNGSPNVFLVRPADQPEISPLPSAASGTPKPTEKATEKPTEKPSEKPTASPTPKPTPSPTPKPTPTPTTAPPPTFAPDVATCPLNTADGVKVAKITYPATWSTVTTPADLKCQYFDPAPITVPSDPTTLVTAVMASSSDTTYADALTDATDSAVWDVTAQETFTLSGLDATAIAATSTADSAGIPAGTSRYAYIVNVGSSGTVTMWTQGIIGEGEFANDSTILSLMVSQSKFIAGS